MKGVTVAVRRDELAMSLREINMVRPPKYQRHRWQVITVNRDDRLSECWIDLGPASQFRGVEFEIPSLWEHSVAELIYIADSKRNDTTWQLFMAEQRAESTLIKDFMDQMEEKAAIIENRTVSGPGGTKARNGFPKKEVLRAANRI